MSVSFTVRRPTPASNDSSDVDSPFKKPALPQRLRDQDNAPRSSSPLNPNGKRALEFDDSDEEHDEVTEELVVGFDRMGAQRAGASTEKKGPLVIPALPNKDWRAAAKEAAEKRRKGYIPDEGKMKIGVDGSQGGLGTRDTINSGPQQAGLIVYKKRKLEADQTSIPDDSEGQTKMETDDEDTPQPEPVSAEQQAVNALIYAAKQANGEIPLEDTTPIAAIPMAASRDDAEAEAYRDDVASRPDSATLDDYKRMPVSQFGTALLMGMGWRPGMGASKSGKGPAEAIVPKARPALLGLGAKPQEVVEGSKNTKPSKRYVPVLALERGESSRSERGSERPRSERDERDREKERDRRDGGRREGDRSRDRSEQRDRDDRSRDRHGPDRDRERDRDYDRRDSKRRDDRDDRRDRHYEEKRRDRYRDDKREDRRDDRRDDHRDDPRRRK